MDAWMVGSLIAAAGVAPIAWVFGRSYHAFSGPSVITCPETHAPAGVQVDASHYAASAVLGCPALRLKDCTRWPERAGCAQECLAEIEAAPDGCLVRTRLSGWYEGQACALCGRPIGEINWHTHKPGLLTPEGQTRSWDSLPPETVPAALASHRPVCWNCHIVETFRRQRPDLVVEVPPEVDSQMRH